MEKSNLKKKPVSKAANKEFVKNTVELNPKLEEAATRTAVISWGRMNPPTVGHEKLANKVAATAKANSAVPIIYLSHSQDAKKNPLTYEDKYMFARAAFGPMIQKSKAKTIIQVMQELQKKFTDVILVVGADRIAEFETLLNKYNGKDFALNSIKVISAGERDPDAEGVEGMSASKMRAAAASGDDAAFKSGLPKKLQRHGQEIYDMVRAGMKLAEELEAEGLLSEAILNLAQRRKRGLVMRKFKTKIAASRNRARRRMASTDKLTVRARRAAIRAVRRKVAGAKGADYANLSPSEKMMIDKRVQKRQKAIERIARKLLPTVRKAEIARLRSQNSNKNEAFEAVFGGEQKEYKRYHQLFNGDSTVKHDRRFKFNKKVAVVEDADILAIIEQVANDIYSSIQLDEMKIKDALFTKADKSGVSLGSIQEAYATGVAAWDDTSAFDTPSQQGFANVSAVIAEGKKPGLWDNIHARRKKGLPPKKPGEEGYPKTLDIEEMNNPEERMYTHAYKAMMDMLDRKKKETKGAAHSISYYVTQIARGYRGIDIKKLQSMIPKDYVFEEYGAGEDGTSKLSKKYKKDTPGESVNEAFENMLNEETQCALITQSDIRELEKFADGLLKDYGIDVEFTRHFGDRMSDERNSPCINVKELKDFFRKVYANKGIKIKGNRGIEAILKDMQKSLNMPVVIDYKNGEVELTFKTIMRKKNFTSPNKVISY
jgi:nicotinic acid mononucleotide adenylyltransferase